MIVGRGSLTFRGAIGLCFAAIACCFALLAITAFWYQARSRDLTDRVDMARVQALLVTRMEADLAHALIGEPELAGSGSTRIAEAARTYLATVDEEGGLIGRDRESQLHQRREAADARRLAMLMSGRPTREGIVQASAIVRAIAARENREVEAASLESRDIRHRTEGLMLAAILALGAVFLLAILSLWRSIVRPVDALIRATDAVATEQSPTRVAETGLRELRMLIRHFNGMAQSVEEKVGRRTVELEAANRRLQDIDGRRRLFLSKVSHELRTPVTVIRGEAEVTLRLDEDAAALREALRHILDSSLFLQRRLDDLLALALAEDGALSFNVDRLDLVDIVRQVEQTATIFARSSGIRLSVSGTGQRVPVMGDGDRLRQALVAVLDNSVKFSPSGGTVSLHVEVADGQSRISISDQGPGVADGDLDRIFDPYARGGAARNGGGTGLGLSLARWIAQAHRGVIVANNRQKGDGLCVSMTLPLAA